jgi:hypothetical protein
MSTMGRKFDEFQNVVGVWMKNTDARMTLMENRLRLTQSQQQPKNDESVQNS